MAFVVCFREEVVFFGAISRNRAAVCRTFYAAHNIPKYGINAFVCVCVEELNPANQVSSMQINEFIFKHGAWLYGEQLFDGYPQQKPIPRSWRQTALRETRKRRGFCVCVCVLRGWFGIRNKL